jgi:hypothetical protein
VPAHDRRHDDPQAQGEDPTRLRAKGVKDFATLLGRSPSSASKEDVRRYQLHLASSGAHTPKINSTVSALRFIFDVTLNRADLAKQMTFGTSGASWNSRGHRPFSCLTPQHSIRRQRSSVIQMVTRRDHEGLRGAQASCRATRSSTLPRSWSERHAASRRGRWHSLESPPGEWNGNDNDRAFPMVGVRT